MTLVVYVEIVRVTLKRLRLDTIDGNAHQWVSFQVIKFHKLEKNVYYDRSSNVWLCATGTSSKAVYLPLSCVIWR